jgi:aminomuconate-semialdehyde/2-hydroxymuconate-6-semialdehyde dehydrogenase
MINFKELLPIKNFIYGEFLFSTAEKTLSSYEPATGEVYTTLPASDSSDVDKAVEAAERAFPMWSVLPASERAYYLRKIASLISENLEAFAQAESLDNGKPVSVAQTVDIPRSSYNFEFFADAITQFGGESFVSSENTLNYVLHQPLGVVGCISPWNLPLYLFTWKIAPALAAGNTVVAKPSEVTPLTAYLLAHICNQAGLPPGVLNIVHGLGSDVGGALSRHPSVRAISFTGSTVTGEKIAKEAGGRFKKLALEMGGKNPTLVFADCDFDRTVSEVARSAFSNQGQICLCGSRIMIEKSIYEKFKTALVEKVSQLQVGDPQDKNSQQGAVVSQVHYDKVLSYLRLAQQEGGEILCGGNAKKLQGRCAKGWFIEPTLIEGLANSSRTNQEEIFGPVATLIPFDSEEQALAMANDSQYGLACSLWTQNLERAHRLAQLIESGIVWVNTWMNRDLRTPFGGMKNSGVGREGGMEALKFFTEAKTVCIHFQGGRQ